MKRNESKYGGSKQGLWTEKPTTGVHWQYLLKNMLNYFRIILLSPQPLLSKDFLTFEFLGNRKVFRSILIDQSVFQQWVKDKSSHMRNWNDNDTGHDWLMFDHKAWRKLSDNEIFVLKTCPMCHSFSYFKHLCHHCGLKQWVFLEGK